MKRYDYEIDHHGRLSRVESPYGDYVEHSDLEEELKGLLSFIPKDLIVNVREGGGPEDYLATLAVSLSKMAHSLAANRQAVIYWARNFGENYKELALTRDLIKRVRNEEIPDKIPCLFIWEDMEEYLISIGEPVRNPIIGQTNE